MDVCNKSRHQKSHLWWSSTRSACSTSHQITQSGYQVASVQKDATKPLLIGTDVLTALCFHLVKESDVSGLDLITGEHLNFDSDKQPAKKDEMEMSSKNSPVLGRMVSQQVE